MSIANKQRQHDVEQRAPRCWKDELPCNFRRYIFRATDFRMLHLYPWTDSNLPLRSYHGATCLNDVEWAALCPALGLGWLTSLASLPHLESTWFLAFEGMSPLLPSPPALSVHFVVFHKHCKACHMPWNLPTLSSRERSRWEERTFDMVMKQCYNRVFTPPWEVRENYLRKLLPTWPLDKICWLRKADPSWCSLKLKE